VAAIAGMERVAVLIGCCAIYEQLYLTGDVPENAKEATENHRSGLLTLYTAILQALCRLIRVFQGRFPYCLFFLSNIACVLARLILSTRKID